MTLIKTSLLNAISVAIKIIALLGLNKVLAIYVGPAGYAAIGQLQNTIQMIQSFAGSSLNNGVIKYTAEYEQNNDNDTQTLMWSTAFIINVVCCLIISVVLLIFSADFSRYFLKNNDFDYVFICLSFTILFNVFNTFLLSIINGKKQVTKYIVINITSSFVGLLFTGGAAFFFGLQGALIALVSNQSIVIFVTAYLCKKLPWFKVSNFLRGFSKQESHKLLGFGLAAFVSAIVIPLSHMGIRDHLVVTYGWQYAGYWDAMWKISSVYLMFITMTLTVYYLPRFSEITDKNELRKELIQGYKLIVPLVIFLSCSIYFFRDYIIQILFTSEFKDMKELFKWQLIGDTIKIISWLLGYILIGKALIKLFIISEIIFSILFYFLSISFINEFGIIGVTYSHTLNYIAYFIFVLFSLKRMKII